jgi:hypothetical protein
VSGGLVPQPPLRRSDAVTRRRADDAGDHRGGEAARHRRARPHHRRQGRARELEGAKVDLIRPACRRQHSHLTMLDRRCGRGLAGAVCALPLAGSSVLPGAMMGEGFASRKRPLCEEASSPIAIRFTTAQPSPARDPQGERATFRINAARGHTPVAIFTSSLVKQHIAFPRRDGARVMKLFPTSRGGRSADGRPGAAAPGWTCHNAARPGACEAPCVP